MIKFFELLVRTLVHRKYVICPILDTQSGEKLFLDFVHALLRMGLPR